MSQQKRERWRPTLRVVAYVPAVLLVSLLLGGLAFWLAYVLNGPAALDEAMVVQSPVGVLTTAASLAASLLVTYAFRHLFDRARLRELGLNLSGRWARDLGAGFLLGVGLIAVVFAIQVLSGGYSVAPGLALQPLGTVLWLLALSSLGFLFVSVAEELIVRGYVLQNLELAWGLPIAVVVSSGVFGIAHLANPGATLVSALGVAAAGLLLAATYVVTRTLWMPIGLHWSWNLFQGPVFGFPVSGLPMDGLVQVEPVGPEWLTGGDFGPEASLVVMALLVLATLAVLKRGRASLQPV